MDLDFFAYHEDDDTYTRTSETCERAYTDEEIRQFIEKSGLEAEFAAYAADSFDPGGGEDPADCVRRAKIK